MAGAELEDADRIRAQQLRQEGETINIRQVGPGPHQAENLLIKLCKLCKKVGIRCKQKFPSQPPPFTRLRWHGMHQHC